MSVSSFSIIVFGTKREIPVHEFLRQPLPPDINCVYVNHHILHLVARLTPQELQRVDSEKTIPHELIWTGRNMNIQSLFAQDGRVYREESLRNGDPLFDDRLEDLLTTYKGDFEQAYSALAQDDDLASSFYVLEHDPGQRTTHTDQDESTPESILAPRRVLPYQFGIRTMS